MRRLAITALLLAVSCASMRISDRNDPTFFGGFLPEAPPAWRGRGAEWGIAFTDTVIVHSAPRSGGIALDESFREDYAEFMQGFGARDYVGQRVRFSAFVKTFNVVNWAGLFMRINSREHDDIMYDDMGARAITGTTNWGKYSVVLDVPEESALIEIGVKLTGRGQVWIDDCTFEVVDKSVPTTAIYSKPTYPRFRFPVMLDYEPINLDFDEELLESAPGTGP